MSEKTIPYTVKGFMTLPLRDEALEDFLDRLADAIQLAPHITFLTSSADLETGELDIELRHRTENSPAALEEYKTVMAAAFTLLGEKPPALDKYTIH